MKVENLTKYTCDVCGKSECVTKGERSPMQELRLPMKYYDEKGRQQGLTNQRIDICSDCFKTLENYLSKGYDMKIFAYVGVSIKRKEGEQK